jgi:murein DD-endopeptidase MepM/ murein hydrolase activator NlpD
VVELPRTTTQVVVEGRIDKDAPSISESLERAGERLDLALAMADIFSGEIDFNSGLQPGDAYRLVVEKSVRDDGLFVGYGPVRAAEFVNDGRTLAAMRFTFPDGKAGYFDRDGRSLKRFFLKTPLKFEPRITSRFSRSRMHPVLKYARAHNGVDYGAPTGAPVVSVSNGTVSFAGWTNGGGRTVRVRHTSGYESEYMHLSAIAPGISPGARVGQGDLLGNVGQTGLASGPHLHYGLRRNGQYVNPITEHQNLPPGEPVPAVLKAAFEAERDTLFSAMRQPARALHANEN